jgi:hypothetical protein
MGFSHNIDFKSFTDIEGMLTSRGQRKIGNNTYLQRRADLTIGLMYHATDVVTFTPDGITLNSGGWRTVTTKERINWVLSGLGLRLFTDKRTWYIIEAWMGWDTKKATVFHDGIQVSYDGKILPPPVTEEGTETNSDGVFNGRFVIEQVLIIHGPPGTEPHHMTVHDVDKLPAGFALEPTIGDTFLTYEDSKTAKVNCSRSFFMRDGEQWLRWPFLDRVSPEEAIEQERGVTSL